MTRWPPLIAYFALVAAGFALLFTRLDDRYLWTDEAETAILATSILEHGVPRLTPEADIPYARPLNWVNDADIWVATPWLDEYLAAASLATFGKNTWAARLPFALAGWLAVALLPLVAYRIWHSPAVALTAGLLYVTTVPMLLHARQCRYYALIMLAQIWLVYALGRAARGDRLSGGLQIALALVVQFYANFFVVLGNGLALGLTSLALARRNGGLFRSTLAAGAGLIAGALPWIVYANPFRLSGMLDVAHVPRQLPYYVGVLHLYVLPLEIVLLVPLVWWRRRQAARAAPSDDGDSTRTTNRDTSRGTIGAVGTVGTARDTASNAAGTEAGRDTAPLEARRAVECFLYMLVPLYVVVVSLAGNRSFPYLTPLLPVLMMLAAVLLTEGVRRVWLRAVLIALLAATNLLADPLGLVPSARWPLAQYVREITTPYSDRIEDIVRYLAEHVAAGQTLAAVDAELPLVFYLPVRVQTIDPAQLDMGDLPEWLLLESVSRSDSQRRAALPAHLAPYYEPREVRVHATAREGVYPTPDSHAPFTAPETEVLVIYKLRE